MAFMNPREIPETPGRDRAIQALEGFRSVVSEMTQSPHLIIQIFDNLIPEEILPENHKSDNPFKVGLIISELKPTDDIAKLITEVRATIILSSPNEITDDDLEWGYSTGSPLGYLTVQLLFNP